MKFTSQNRFAGLLVASSLAAAALHYPVAHGAITFNGATDNDITKPSNWGGATPNFGATDVRWNINGTTEYTVAQGVTTLSENRDLVIASGDNTVGSLTITGGAINLAGASAALVSAPGTGTASGSLVLAGGNLSTPGEISVLARGSATATGVLTVGAGSTLTAGTVSFGNLAASAGTGTININVGGTIVANTFRDQFAVTNSIINVDGGTLKGPAAGSSDWIRSGIEILNIGSSGATIDTNGASQKIQPSGGISGSGAISITGGGTVVLTGPSSHNGPINVSASTLTLESTAALQSQINLSSKSTLQGEGATQGSASFSNGSALSFDPFSSGRFTAGTINTTAGNVQLVPTSAPSGSDIVVMESVNGAITSNGISDFFVQARGTLSFTVDGKQLLFTSGAPASLKWKGANATNPTYWDTTTPQNFSLSGIDDLFLQGDNVEFDDTAGNFNPTVQAPVSAGALAFNNATQNYTLSGASVAATSLTKSGAAKLTVTQATTIPSVTINSGEVQVGDGLAGVATFGAVNVANSGTLTYDFGSNNVARGTGSTISGTGNFVKNGSGRLDLVANISGISGTTTINDGQLRLNPGAIVNLDTLFAGSATGELEVTGTTSSITLDRANTYDGPTEVQAGSIVLDGAGTLGSTVSGTTVAALASLGLGGGASVPAAETLTISGAGVAANNQFFTGSRGSRGAVQSISGSSVVDAAITIGAADTRIGVQNDASITLNGTISEATPGFGLIFRSAATGMILVKGTGNSWSGVTGIYGNTTKLGVNNALPAASLLRVGTNGIGASTLDLNGFNLTSSGIQNTGALDVDAIITNDGASDSTLSVSPATDQIYSGVIQDGVSKVHFVKQGSMKQTLNGTMLSYTGNTTIEEGTLTVTSANFSDTSTVTIGTTGGASAVLELPTAGTDLVGGLVIDGANMGPGIYDAISHPLDIAGAGKLQVSAVGSYGSWASANVDGQAPNLDFDNDGTSNGIEYFMNAPAGFTANPGVSSTGTVEWANGGNISSGSYGTGFLVQTSPNLSVWTDILASDPNLNNTSGSVKYTLPAAGGKLFVRLLVNAN